MKEKFKTVYLCTHCGEVSLRWLGQCPSCGSWNTLIEDVIKETSGSKTKQGRMPENSGTPTTVHRLDTIDTNEQKSRIITGIRELDRVLGGGIVLGSVVLLGGEPGAGKSTMLLQLCGSIGSDCEVLYVTGEESIRQIKLRAKRLQVAEQHISVAAESNIDSIVETIEQQKPGFVVVDSIQTMYTPSLSSSAGSVSQVKESTARLQAVAKQLEVPIFIVGHVNKDGAIAGPKVMEHIVDTVMYFSVLKYCWRAGRLGEVATVSAAS